MFEYGRETNDKTNMPQNLVQAQKDESNTLDLPKHKAIKPAGSFKHIPEVIVKRDKYLCVLRVSIYVYIYIYTYTHLHMYTCIHVYI